MKQLLSDVTSRLLDIIICDIRIGKVVEVVSSVLYPRFDKAEAIRDIIQTEVKVGSFISCIVETL